MGNEGSSDSISDKTFVVPSMSCRSSLFDKSENNHGVVVVRSVINAYCGPSFDSAWCIPFFKVRAIFFDLCSCTRVQLFIPKLIPNFFFQPSYVHPCGLAYCTISNYSSRGVTWDRLDEFVSPSNRIVTWDMPKNSSNWSNQRQPRFFNQDSFVDSCGPCLLSSGLFVNILPFTIFCLLSHSNQPRPALLAVPPTSK